MPALPSLLPRRVRLAGFGLGACALAGCGADSWIDGLGLSNGGQPGEVTSASSAALLVHEIRVHPLTRLARDDRSGSVRMLVHVEMLDAFGHGTKGLGTLRVELYRPAQTGERGGAAQDLVWTVDLTNAQENSAAYDDRVSKTYLVILEGLPVWVDRWWQGESREPWVSLEVFFTTPDGDGGTRRLEAGYRLVR